MRPTYPDGQWTVLDTIVKNKIHHERNWLLLESIILFVIEDTYPARRQRALLRTCCWWRIPCPCLFWPPSGLSCASSGWGCLPIDWYRRICLEYLEVLYPLTLDRWLDPRRIHHTDKKKINKIKLRLIKSNAPKNTSQQFFVPPKNITVFYNYIYMLCIILLCKKLFLIEQSDHLPSSYFNCNFLY